MVLLFDAPALCNVAADHGRFAIEDGALVQHVDVAASDAAAANERSREAAVASISAVARDVKSILKKVLGEEPWHEA